MNFNAVIPEFIVSVYRAVPFLHHVIYLILHNRARPEGNPFSLSLREIVANDRGGDR